MKWSLRFLGLATLFAIPCYFLTGPWQQVLGSLATSILSRFGIQIEMSEVQIMAPFDLGIYLAMCLASRRAPPIVRRRAIEWGSILMVLLEIATIVAAILIYFALESRDPTADSGLRLMQNLIEFVPWASATTVWLLMLGAWELPLGTLAAEAARVTPPRGASGRAPRS